MPKLSTKSAFSIQKSQLTTTYFGVNVCLGILGIIILALLCPFTLSDSATATDTTTTATTRASVDIQTTLTVALSPKVEMTALPSTDGIFTSGSANLNISTNNRSGYTVYVNTAESTTAMRANGLADEIKALGAPANASNFGRNTWGYDLTKKGAAGEKRYTGIALDPVQADTLGHTTSGETYELTFGAKVDNTIAAGKYSNEVVVSVIANPFEITQLSEALYMQDVTAEVCQGTGEIAVGAEETKQLIDTRDGKKYWVAKLADQNCWMTQNLALDLKTNTPLTPDTSDVSQTWTPSYNTATEIPHPSTIADGSSETWAAKSWNLGEYVPGLSRRANTATCNLTPPSGYTGETNTNTVYYGQTLSQCPGFQNVAGWSPTLDATTQGTGWDWGGIVANESTGSFVTVNTTEKTYDAHYLIGNYYTWGAATAGTGGKNLVSSTVTSNVESEALAQAKTAPESICPKGWGLPISLLQQGSTPLDLDRSYRHLFKAYGRDITMGVILLRTDPFIYGSPIHFVQSGSLLPTQGILTSAGIGYIQWSATAGTDYNTANILQLIPNGLALNNSSEFNYRYFGNSIRCVVKK